MRIYGLTGGTGSGKSTAGKRFEARGIPVIDADKIGHEVYEPGGPAYDAVREAFGDAILTGGRVDREKLSALVFRDETARKKLNAIVHPAIQQVIAQRCMNLAQEGHNTVLIDAALLGENGTLDPWLEGLILVTAPESVRVQRLVEQRGIDPEEARRRIRAQTPPEKKVALANWVIENGGTLNALHTQVDAITEVLKHG